MMDKQRIELKRRQIAELEKQNDKYRLWIIENQKLVAVYEKDIAAMYLKDPSAFAPLDLK